MKKIFFAAYLISTTLSVYSQTDIECVTSEELKLYNLINEYRKKNKLSKIEISKSLNYVAKLHCKDLDENKPDKSPCNAHSWSDKGDWKGCCFTPDFKEAVCMWSKPAELTNYKGYGYEIAFGSSDVAYSNYAATAETAMNAWKSSPGHNNVLLSADIWKSYQWGAVGVAVYKGFAVVWFGKEKDVLGEPKMCK